MEDRHVGRRAIFPIEGDPNRYIELIDRHGVFARVQQARQCPCSGREGVPDRYCNTCKGQGFVYRFQRRFLSADEDADIRGDRSKVFPWRVPLLEPLYVIRTNSQEAGGSTRYNIVRYDSYSIKIQPPAGDRLPYSYERLMLSYYFDRFVFAENDTLTKVTGKILATTKTKADLGIKGGNFDEAHGDIAVIEKLWDASNGYEYSNYEFRSNYIILGGSEPEPTDPRADYFYVPVTKVLPADLDSSKPQDNWITQMDQANLRIGLEPWYDLGPGDLITFLTPQFFREQTIGHSATGIDILQEYYVGTIDDEILGEDGTLYKKNVDFVFVPYREIHWIGNQPASGEPISVRYGYRPTYKVFQENSQPNRMENKRFPIIVFAKLYNMADGLQESKIQNKEYANQVTDDDIPVNPFQKFIGFPE